MVAFRAVSSCVKSRRQWAVLALTIALTAGLAVVTTSATADAAVSPIADRAPTGVTADALPTVQIDGVVWSQAVVGNTVYAGGSFANARPAGAAPGTNQTPRANLLAYNLTTGALITSFAPSLNGQVKSVVASPDGSRIYVGGSFTAADGQNRYRLAAYNTATGALVASFAPTVDATVNSLTVTNTTVYAGGIFGTANGSTRLRLAAFSASTGALLGWAPSADGVVDAVQLTPDNGKVIVGGAFANVNGSPSYGLGAIDSSNGALLPWAINSVVQDYGNDAAILSLSTDGTSIFGAGYVYGTPGNFEGVFSADPSSGAINWLADCHGDSYGAFGSGTQVYVVSHEHFCSNIGGFPDTNPRNVWKRTSAFTTQATGTVSTNTEIGGGYGDFAGQPSPSLVNWFPDLDAGTYTGQSQGAWTVTGTSQYVVEGGEFLHVNGTAQQGLVRFAVPSIAPGKRGPQVTDSSGTPSAVPLAGSVVRVNWQANWDQDDQKLTYQLFRNDVSSTQPVYTTTANSQFWNRPQLSYTDTSVKPKTSYTYWVRALDPNGNTVRSANTTVTTSASGASESPYVADVLSAAPSHYWRLGEASGSQGVDVVSNNPLVEASGVTPGANGAIAGDPDTAATFSGTSTGTAGTTSTEQAPNVFTVGGWVKTTSTSGGKVIGFGDSQTGSSGSWDRMVYLDNAGHLVFEVYSGGFATVTSQATYNDGRWHQFAASLGASGLSLYADGALVASRTNVAATAAYAGYWRVGGDTVAGTPAQPTSGYLAGSIDEVAVYPSALTASQIATQFTDAGGSSSPAPAAGSAYRTAVLADAPSSYWQLNETAGITVADSSGNGRSGTLSGGATPGRPGAPVDGPRTAVQFDGSTGSLASDAAVTTPNTYTQELWFQTSTTKGGKIIGYGGNKTGNSGSWDRQVDMLPSGQLSLEVFNGDLTRLNSAGTYNDGAWHYLVATESSAGARLYVDNQLVGSSSTTPTVSYNAYLRVGGDSSNVGSSGYFAGTVDEVAVYPVALTAAQINNHATAALATQTTNAAPTAAFTSSCQKLACSFDGTGSKDSDGTIKSYAWSFGDSATSTAATPSHTYATAGSFVVRLTVTDDGGATATVSRTVVTVGNQAPVAAFTPTCSALACSFDATASSDQDGRIVSYAWTFGDGTTGSGRTTTHAYATAGQYQAALTVTDDQGATNTTSATVTVTAPPKNGALAADAFARTTTNGWGSADTGGAWTVTGGASAFATGSGVGTIKLNAAGAAPTATLSSVAAQNIVETVDVAADTAATGNGTYVMLRTRVSGNSYYVLKLRLLPGGVVHLAVSKVVNGAETAFREVNVPSLTYTPGDVLRTQFAVTGNGTSTTVSGTVWKAGSTQPATAQISQSDTESGLQGSGSLALVGYLAASSTSAPTTLTVDNLSVVPSK